MKIGFFQWDVRRTPCQNIQLISDCLQNHRCDLLLLPELCMGGYLFADKQQLLAAAQPVPNGPAVAAIKQLSKQHQCTIVFGLAEKEGQAVYNTAAVVSRGSYVGKYRKIHLIDYEKTLFAPGDQLPLFQVEGIRLGVQICFDLWFPEICRQQLLMGADLFCALANFGGQTTLHIAGVRATENLTPLVLCNRVGAESLPGIQADFLGKSCIFGADGQPLCAAPAGKPHFAAANIALPPKRGNVICGDFWPHIALHHPAP